jgi:hypothetical protein
LAAGHRPPALALSMSSMTDTDSIILGVAAFEGPPLEDAIIAHAETRPAPDFSKT